MVIENISYRIHEKEKDNGISCLDEFMEEINTDIDATVLARDKTGFFEEEASGANSWRFGQWNYLLTTRFRGYHGLWNTIT